MTNVLTEKFQSLSLFSRIFIITTVTILFTLGIIALINRIFHLAGIPYSYIWLILVPIGIAFIISYLAAKFVEREVNFPIRQFIDSAKEIARGNFDHKINVHGSQEMLQLARIFNYMTIELKRIYDININQIIREKIKTEAILRNIADGVIVSGPFDEVLLLNDIVETWFNVKEKDVLGCSLAFFIPELKPLLEKTKQSFGNEILLEEIETEHDDPVSNIVLAAHASKVLDQGDLIGIVIVLRNITKEKQIDKMKTELVSVVAHELRSPLTSIAGFSEVLKDPEMTPARRKEFMDIIHYESGRLADMIDKFLNISRIESGQTVINKIPIDIASTIASVVNINATLAQKKNISVKLNIQEGMPFVNADPDLIGQVILNLFSNAIKYSREDSSITLGAEWIDEEIKISVEDMGFGISKENMKNLFQKFFRAKDDKRIKSIEGTGLGLAFVKEIVQQHGGKIHVESEWGKGSTFSFTLPAGMQTSDKYEAKMIASTK
ncbi:cell wall metabolism sensor histidine kinase WalK [bacterium]|nr:cell wall metabolism sensor histidine kinase WalK [bacterium]